MQFLDKILPLQNQTVTLPNGVLLPISHSGYLPTYFALPELARHVFVLPALTQAIISVGTLCRSGCNVTFSDQEACIELSGNIILRARHPTELSTLWELPFPDPQQSPGASLANLIHHDTNASMVAFYHAAMGSPAVPTFATAISKGFLVLPGLTMDILSRNVPNPLATAQGHLNLHRQGLRSTKSASPEETAHADSLSESPLDTFPSTSPHATNTLFCVIHATAPLVHRVHADLPGRLPMVSMQGNSYMMLFLHEDANYIHVEPLMDRSSASITKAARRAIQLFRSMGLCPNVQRLDNEASKELITVMQDEFGIRTELAPPHNHRTLRAERAIRTFKDHFISTLCTTDPSFPLNQWDAILPHTLTTLNLMRASALQPHLSAYEQLYGPYNFNAHPIIPLGMQVLIHERSKSQRSTTWSPHGLPGFYLGPAMLHFRCYRIWVTQTGAERISDTISWHPQHLHLPGSSAPALLQAAIEDLTNAVLRTAPASDRDFSAPNFRLAMEALRDAYVPPATTGSDDQAEPARRVLTWKHKSSDPERVSPPPVTTFPPADSSPQTIIPPLSPTPLAVSPPSKSPALIAQSPESHSTTPCPQAQKIGPRPDHHQQSRRSHNTPARYLAHLSSDSTPPPPLVLPALQYGKLMRGPDSVLWEAECAKEFIRLLETTACMHFCPRSEIPRGYKIKYFKAVCTIKRSPNDSPIFRVRGTVADTKSTYTGPISTPTASINVVYLLLNAAVSEKANWMTADIKDYYLGTPMSSPEYMRIPAAHIPQVIRAKYSLPNLGEVFVAITKGMYGLAQAGRLAQDRLKTHLATAGYHEAPSTPCLFIHTERPTKFSLVVDDFGVKYATNEDLNHLLDTLRSLYTITTDMLGEAYLGLSIHYDKSAPAIHVSLPDTIREYLTRYQFTTKTKLTIAPMVHRAFAYGTTVISPLPPDESLELPPVRVKRLQSILGALLHYARVVDPTMLCTVNKLASSRYSVNTETAVDHLLHYASCWPNATITFRPSDMVLHVHSDASYLSETKGRSRAGGFHFLGPYEPTSTLPPNGFIDTISSIIDVVVSSAFEAEAAAIFINAQRILIHRATLEDLGYPQQATCIISDNLTAVKILNGNFSPKRSRCMDMRYYWIQDRISQGQFSLTWLPGSSNLADFFTKTHPATHYKALRSTFVSDSAPPHGTSRVHLPAPHIPVA